MPFFLNREPKFPTSHASDDIFCWNEITDCGYNCRRMCLRSGSAYHRFLILTYYKCRKLCLLEYSQQNSTSNLNFFKELLDNQTTYATRHASKQSVSTDLMQCLLILKSFLLQWNIFLTCSFIKVNIKVNTKLISSGISNRRISHWVFSTTHSANKWWQVVTSANLHCYIINCYIWQLGSDDTFACDMIVVLSAMASPSYQAVWWFSFPISFLYCEIVVHAGTVTPWIVTWHV